MFLSYAKDLVVVLQETNGFDKDKYNELLKATLEGGKALYAGRPGANTAPSAPTASPVSKQDLEESWNKAGNSAVEDVFGGQEQINIDDIPF